MQRVAYITKPARQMYAAMAVALDDGVGQVLTTLQAQNLLENTLIFFLRDNGRRTRASLELQTLPCGVIRVTCWKGVSAFLSCPMDREVARKRRLW